MNALSPTIQNSVLQSLPKTAPVSVGVLSLLAYHKLLHRREMAGEATWRTSQADTRQTWARFVRKSEGWLYAVQTLRNAITANTFLATTVLSLLTVITGKLWTSSIKGDPYQRLQFATVALSMLRSAYEFLQSARLMTHAGFMFPTVGEETDEIMRKSTIAQWMGLRWLYIGGTFMVWILGGEKAFMVACLLMTRFFWNIDKAPSRKE